MTRLPTLFFIDTRGVIQNVKVGFLEYSDLKKLALNIDYKDEIRTQPRELFNGVNLIRDFWGTIFKGFRYEI